MSLRKKQSRFTLHVAFLILEAEKLGYEITLGDAFRDSRVFGEIGDKKGYSHAYSLHKSRLAIDLNLFDAEGGYITDSTGHKELHEWWVENGGNKIIPDDPNHYSWPHGDMK